jgi:hypothetical protein
VKTSARRKALVACAQETPAMVNPQANDRAIRIKVFLMDFLFIFFLLASA